MCGIAGILDLKGERNIDRTALERMAAAIAHRGPDGEGFHLAPGLGLAHRRLVIVDPEGGAQPFSSSDSAGVLVFNGMIYNYRELAADLVARGVPIKTRSDTECLAEGLAKDGEEFIDRLRGMFAFGFWSENSKTLTLARDRLGERPLYYAETPDGFLVFASEIGAILSSGLIARELDPQAVADYFLYGFVPDPKAIWRGVKKLPPGVVLTASRGRAPALRRYWTPAFNQDTGADYARAQEEMLARLDDAVKAQMIADVPLGAFLSGGVDSSAVVSSMALAGGEVKTCSIGFDEDSHDERRYARQVAAQYETTHTEEIASLDAAALIDVIARVYGEPFADTSALPTYLVAKLARRHVTVALTGDGGDEIFAGYRRYPFFTGEERLRAAAPLALRRATFGLAGALWPKLDWAPRPLRWKTTLQSLGASRADAYARAVAASLPERAARMMSGDLKTTLGGYDPRSVIEDAMGERREHPLLAAQRADLAVWLPGRMLTKVDRASMAHALEARPPLLDHKLVEWAGTLPADFKLHDGAGKRILKAALEARLPRDILYRKKQGFGLPVAEWLRREEGPLSRLDGEGPWRACGLLDPAAIDAMADAHRKGAADNSQELWTVIMFDAFLRNAA